MQTTLTETQAERDALAAQVGDAGGTATGLQAELASAHQNLIKLREVLPIVRGAAEKHEHLEQAGFVSALVAADRRR